MDITENRGVERREKERDGKGESHMYKPNEKLRVDDNIRKSISLV